MDEQAKIKGLIRDVTAALSRLDDAACQGLEAMAAGLASCLEAGGRVLVCGNGGSAADAQHIAGELAGRFRRDRKPLACIALTTDTSVLTAVGNDYSFAEVFSRQVEALGRPGDLLWAMSTSGRSPNVVAAARAAREADIKVLAMTGAAGGPLADLADWCFRSPADRTDLIQQMHQLAYHILCELLDERFGSEDES
mgnify:CR=1 FL=1